MKNIKDELLKDVIGVNLFPLKWGRINFHRFNNVRGDLIEEFNLKFMHKTIDYEVFLNNIDFEYDDGDKSKDNVNGTAIMKDGTMFTKSTFNDNKSWRNHEDVVYEKKDSKTTNFLK